MEMDTGSIDTRSSGPVESEELSEDFKADLDKILEDGQVTLDELKELMKEHGEEMKAWIQALAGAQPGAKGEGAGKAGGAGGAKEAGGAGGGQEAGGAGGGKEAGGAGGGKEAGGAQGAGGAMDLLRQLIEAIGSGELAQFLQQNPQLQQMFGDMSTGSETPAVTAPATV